jgi:hypothetical protein
MSEKPTKIIKKKKNKNKKKKPILITLEDFPLSELHIEYNQQLQAQKEWDDYMISKGLSTLRNFEFLPQYKPEITYEMLVFDYNQPEDKRWKNGDRYPLKGDIVKPHITNEISNNSENLNL